VPRVARPEDPAVRSAVARIRKLLALAEDQQGTPEGDAAARLARRMMLRYDLAARAVGEAEDDPVVRIELAIDGHVLWRRRLASAVATHCECLLSWSPSEARAWLYGRRSGVVVAEYLHAVLLREVQGARERHDADLPMMLGDKERTRRLGSFTTSAVLAIEHRLRALRQDEATTSPQDCALIRRRGRDLRDWMAEHGVRFTRGAPSVFAYSAEGYAAGHAIALHDAMREQGEGQAALPR